MIGIFYGIGSGISLIFPRNIEKVVDGKVDSEMAKMGLLFRSRITNPNNGWRSMSDVVINFGARDLSFDII